MNNKRNEFKIQETMHRIYFEARPGQVTFVCYFGWLHSDISHSTDMAVNHLVETFFLNIEKKSLKILSSYLLELDIW